MDYDRFLELVNEEISFLDAFDLGLDPILVKGMAALLQLQEYIPYMQEKERRVAEADTAMQECIDAAWECEDPDVQAKRREIFGTDAKPDLLEFVLRLAEVARAERDPLGQAEMS